MTKSTVHTTKDTDSRTKAEVAAHDAFPEIFKATNAIIIQPKKPLSLETAGSELYAAIMNGEIHNVRAQLAHGDKVTEAEATMLIRARDKAREKGAKRVLQEAACATEKRKSKKKSEEIYYVAPAADSAKVKLAKAIKAGTAATGNVVVDPFGGRYTSGGYEMADGSYLSTSGEFYNAQNNVLTLSNGKAYRMVDDLPVSMASVVRLAQQVRSVRNTNVELDFITPAPAAAAETVAAAPAAPGISPALIAIVADAANIAAAAADQRAREIMENKAFEEAGNKAPAAAITRLDGMPGLSAEDIHMAIQLHRKALRENRSADILTEADCRDILEVREGLACIDTSSMKRIRYTGDEREGISVSFNPASRQPIVIEAAGEMGRSIKACFTKARNGNKVKAATPVHPKMAVA